MLIAVMFALLTQGWEHVGHVNVRESFVGGQNSVRRNFVEKQLTLESGDSPDKVRDVLGEPDRIEIPEYAKSYEEDIELWIYGSHSSSTPEYFGSVLFIDGRIRYQPRAGREMPSSLPSETELKGVFAALLQVGTGVRGLYSPVPNPRAVVRAVNRMVALPRAEAIGAFREFNYSRWSVSGPNPFSNGYYSVVQLFLGVPEEGYQRAPLNPSISSIRQDRKYPRFPVYVYKQLPIQISDLFPGSGMPESFESYFDRNVDDYGVRSTPLKPAIAAWEVFEIVEPILDQIEKDGGRTLDAAQRIWTREHLFDQCLNLLDTVLEIPHEGRWSRDEMEEFAAKAIVELRKKRVRWDDENMRYEFPNGTVLPGSDPLLEPG